MAKLGEAYVAVHADLKPFEKDLDRGLKVIVDKFEKTLDKRLGKKFGTDIGTGAREGLRESFAGIGKDIDSELGGGKARTRGRRVGRDLRDGIGDELNNVGPIQKALSSLVTALEDGFSSLPIEVKAVVGGLLLAALVPVGAFVGAAVAAATIAGLVGIGTALAFQFDEVQTRGKRFVDSLRLRFVNAAESFIGPLDKVFDDFDYRLAILDPTIREVFQRAADYVVPLADGISGLVDGALRGLDRGLRGLDFTDFSTALTDGLTEVGDAIGYLFQEVLSNPDLPQALTDLLTVTSALIIATGDLLSFFISAYKVIGDVAEIVGFTVGWLGDLVTAIDAVTSAGVDTDRLAESWRKLAFWSDENVSKFVAVGGATKAYRVQIDGTVRSTDAETKALKALNKQLKDQDTLVNDLISTNVEYQASIDQTIADFDEYDTSLKAGDENGRRNIKNIQEQINNLKDYTTAQVTSGKMTTQAAQSYYNTQITLLEQEFTKRHGNIKQFEEIFGWLIRLQTFPQIPDKFGPFKISLQDTNTLINAVYQAALALSKVPAPKLPSRPGNSGHGPQAYAGGGMITSPTMALMGENYRPELVLPVSQPTRSAQLLANSPLAGSVMGQTNVAVYIGDEQLQGRMYRVASGVSQANARNITQRPRSI